MRHYQTHGRTQRDGVTLRCQAIPKQSKPTTCLRAECSLQVVCQSTRMTNSSYLEGRGVFSCIYNSKDIIFYSVNFMNRGGSFFMENKKRNPIRKHYQCPRVIKRVLMMFYSSLHFQRPAPRTWYNRSSLCSGVTRPLILLHLYLFSSRQITGRSKQAEIIQKAPPKSVSLFRFKLLLHPFSHSI